MLMCQRWLTSHSFVCDTFNSDIVPCVGNKTLQNTKQIAFVTTAKNYQSIHVTENYYI